MATYVDSNLNDPSLFFEAVTYTGNTSSGTTNNDLSFQPNMVWFKSRTQTENHQIYDSVRGATKRLVVNGTQAEATAATGLTSFDSDGFTTGGEQETDSGNIVAWCWKESATAGFDIVQFTGNETARTISHNLSAVPKMIIIKNPEEGAAEWPVYHAGNPAPSTGRLFLSGTHAMSDNATFFNDTDPTSSVFSVGTSSDVNGNTNSMISYVFADVQGFSSAFKFTGNGNSNGPFVWCNGVGNIAFLMIKRSDSTSDWHIYDNKRSDSGGGNPNDQYLEADTSNAEASGLDVDFVAGGFKIRSSSADINASGGTYIGFAVASAPFVNSNGVPCNAR